MKVTIYLKNDKVMSAENVDISEDVTRLILEDANGDYSVVPLASVNFYEVEVN